MLYFLFTPLSYYPNRGIIYKINVSFYICHCIFVIPLKILALNINKSAWNGYVWKSIQTLKTLYLYSKLCFYFLFGGIFVHIVRTNRCSRFYVDEFIALKGEFIFKQLPNSSHHIITVYGENQIWVSVPFKNIIGCNIQSCLTGFYSFDH